MLKKEQEQRQAIEMVCPDMLVSADHLLRQTWQTWQDVNMNIAYRWFPGYGMSRQLPHFATISYAFRHRLTEETVEAIFCWILEEIEKAAICVRKWCSSTGRIFRRTRP